MSETPLERALTAVNTAIDRWSDQPLRSIFSEIVRVADSKEENSTQEPIAQPDRQDYIPPQRFLQAQRFTLTRSALFPQAEVQKAAASLRQDFDQARSKLATPTNANLGLEQTLALLHDYAWAVSYEAADFAAADDVVSLYDYARTEAALAAAEFDGSAGILFGGDLSGVQDFIYTIAADKAAKSLRGRSVYLQLLTDAIAYWILQQAGMPSCNLLYSGGGRFYLILPDTAAQSVAQWRQQLGQFLLNVHDGELYMALGSAPITNSSSDFSAVFRAVNDDVTSDKRRRFASLDPAVVSERIFSPRGHRGNEDDRCNTCGFMGASDLFITDVDIENAENPERRCRLCDSTIDLGQRLHDAQFLCRRLLPANLTATTTRQSSKAILAGLGFATEVCRDERELMKHLNSTKAQKQTVHVQIIQASTDTTAMLDRLRAAYPEHIFQFRPIVNVTAMQDGKVKSFDQFADDSQGIKRFGVLRMDVDDLGDIFGYSVKKASLARISSLSIAFARFFEGWVGEICRNAELVTHLYPTKQLSRQPTSSGQVYSVYSGGDDLFLVGGWDVLAHVANQIQRDLADYTGQNQLIHVSAGLTLHSPKFPLYQAAKAAAGALDQAKSAPERLIKSQADGVDMPITKHALHFLEQTIAWEAFEQLNQWHTELWQFYQGEEATVRSLLQTLMELYNQYLINSRSKDPTKGLRTSYGPWIWRGNYQLARIIDQSRNHANLKKLAEKAKNTLLKGIDLKAYIGLRTIEQLGLSARWTQLLIRSKGAKNDRD